MNEEDYVTYEQAVKLKDLGFNLECFCFYTHYKDFWIQGLPINHNENSYYISAPTLSQAAKWLREKGLFINVWLCASGYGWKIDKCGNPNCNGTTAAIFFDEDSGDDVDSSMFTTYEKALSDAIDKALEILKEK